MPEFLLPDSVEQATGLMAEHGNALKVMAGGTNLLRYMPPGAGGYVMGLNRLGLDEVEQVDGGWSIGSGVTMARLRADVGLPVLQAAARQVGGPAVQNMATIGGNLHARQPYGDVAVALLALDAMLTFVSPAGERTQPLAEFFSAWHNGSPPSGELLTRVNIPAPAGEAAFLKHGHKALNSSTIVSVAARIVKQGGSVAEARIALGGCGPHPLRCEPAEDALTGSALDEQTIAAAAKTAETGVSPATDAVATEWYRRRMAGVFVRRALQQLA